MSRIIVEFKSNLEEEQLKEVVQHILEKGEDTFSLDSSIFTEETNGR